MCSPWLFHASRVAATVAQSATGVLHADFSFVSIVSRSALELRDGAPACRWRFSGRCARDRWAAFGGSGSMPAPGGAKPRSMRQAPQPGHHGREAFAGEHLARPCAVPFALFLRAGAPAGPLEPLL